MKDLSLHGSSWLRCRWFAARAGRTPYRLE